MNVHEKLLAVQTELKAPKSQYNQFGKYNYRSAEDILEAVKPVCKANKAVIYLSDCPKFLEGRHYIEATAFFVDVETGEKISVTASAREDEGKKGMDGAQLSGATSSYARKYALNGLLDVDDCKDSDELDGAEAKTATFNHVAVINGSEALCADCGGEIVDAKDDGGKRISADRLIKSSKEKFGVPLCYGCAGKRAAK